MMISWAMNEILIILYKGMKVKYRIAFELFLKGGDFVPLLKCE